MNPWLDKLNPYPFERLTALLADVAVPSDRSLIPLSLGEPKGRAPKFILNAATDIDLVTRGLATYPPTRGLPELRSAIAGFVTRRFKLQSIDPESQVLPVSGTREALFSFAQAVIDNSRPALTLMPNPFYQIYEGAALLAGSSPRYVPCLAETDFNPDFSCISEQEWRDCQLLYLCTPGNPSGSIMSIEQLQTLIKLSDEHNFVIASDECYSEIYDDERNPPAGILEAAAAMGRHDFKNCIAFNSLSKRSNLPGLRSGYVCGDAGIVAKFLLYRTYHGAAMPVHNQLISAAAWNDEHHVVENRSAYRLKFDVVLEILKDVWPMRKPPASFYLWPETPFEDTEFTRRLMAIAHVKVVPGSFLSRTSEGINPGAMRVRLALVAEVEECAEAAQRIKDSWAAL